jgi:hypothetical protein
MATITINSDGSLTPTYNLSGVTMVTVLAGDPGEFISGTGNAGTIIPMATGHTIALVQSYSTVAAPDGNTPSRAVNVATLPATAQVGDSVEIYAVDASQGPSSGLIVFPPVGSSIYGLPVSTGTNSQGTNSAGYPEASPYYSLNAYTGRLFRKVASTSWVVLGGA